MKKLLFTILFVLFFIMQIFSQEPLKYSEKFFGKKSQYIGLWIHMGYGYRVEPIHRLHQASARIGYGYFLTDRFSPLISGAYLYTYVIDGDRTLLTHYIAAIPAMRYYFTPHQKLFLEGSYNWVRQWDFYNFKADNIRNLQALALGLGVNLKLIRKGRYSWLKNYVSFEVLYKYHFPITQTRSLYFTGGTLRIGLVLYY